MNIQRVLLQDFINDICILTDKGYEIEINQVKLLMENRNIKEYFSVNYLPGEIGIRLQLYSFSSEDWNTLETILQDTYRAYNNGELGIVRYGMLYLVALANTHLRSIIS